jgi:hypothetical protein
MPLKVEVIGVYPIEASDPVHLVELIIRDSDGKFSFYDITQEVPGQPKDNWQVPYDEKILNADGTSIKSDPFFNQDTEDDWLGDVRIIFFFHYLNPESLMKTPFGDVVLPPESDKPDRLDFVKYEAP